MVAKAYTSEVGVARVSPRILLRAAVLLVSTAVVVVWAGCNRRVGDEEAIAMMPKAVRDTLPTEVRVIGFADRAGSSSADGPGPYRRWLLWTPNRLAVAEDTPELERQRIPAESVRAAVAAELQDGSLVEAKEPFAEVTGWQDAGLIYWLAQMSTSDGWYVRLETVAVPEEKGGGIELKDD